jgi:thioredoxin 1
MKGNFKDLINSDKPVLIDFYAEWCQPCKIQSPILQEIAREMNNKVKIIKIDVDKNQEIAFKYQVQSVPTLMLFKNGSVHWRQAGLIQKGNLIALINSKV